MACSYLIYHQLRNTRPEAASRVHFRFYDLVYTDNPDAVADNAVEELAKEAGGGGGGGGGDSRLCVLMDEAKFTTW